ncbi:MAG: NAD(P)/FAD-dependent oxidoreductase [Endomicrobia bacterium]|nr:NAD(P)/FAD-dependent oxidoreductase [Endomicrobiia bacterium]
MQKYKFVIIGSGPAGINAAKYILNSGIAEDELVVITKETKLYNRIYLIDYIFDAVDGNKILYSNELTDRLNITLAEEVIYVDVKNKIVITRNNKRFSYEKLLICSGATPILPKIKLPKLADNIFCIRTIEDAEKIKVKIKQAKHITIVGCGAVGVELLDGIVTNYPEKQVVVIEKNGWVLPSLLVKNVARDIMQEIRYFLKLRAVNVRFFFNTTIRKLNFKQQKIVTTLSNNKEFSTDLLIFAMGVTPNTILNKVKVDEYCRTNYNDIYLCGDATKFGNKYYPNFINALYSGITAAKNALGENIKLESYQQSNVIEVFNLVLYVRNYFDLDNKKLKVLYNVKNDSAKQYICALDNKIYSIVWTYKNYVDIKRGQLHLDWIKL